MESPTLRFHPFHLIQYAAATASQRTHRTTSVAISVVIINVLSKGGNGKDLIRLHKTPHPLTLIHDIILVIVVLVAVTRVLHSVFISVVLPYDDGPRGDTGRMKRGGGR